ncbi:ATP-binding protein [Psychrobacter sp. I-STPA6b]|uniref:ATP-binding protein n=1 Tax=Psychrobacter sp. I-STPA6b TaxID=2585718 RepID=UPI001D0C72A2|nr:ATP-binding protein [Psychrobacter sp. I-STPA6b]
MGTNINSTKSTSVTNNSVLLYNTQNIDADILKAGFSIRKKEYQRIWKDIQTGTMENPETHYLIQGVRGAGKTTLLSRLAYEVAEDEKLKQWLIPILLNEEEYGILSLFTFWLRIAEKLAEQDTKNYAQLFKQVASLDDNAEMAWEIIRSYLEQQKQKIIVFVDNLGELFKDFDDNEHAQLREVLSLHPQIRLIGGSSQLLEAHFDVSAPFYQFFKLVTLKPINEAEMHELLRSLAKQTSPEAVQTIEEIISLHPERIEAVRRLTDGVPRTIVLLFQIIMEGAKESSYAYLEETIDKTTPLYKHRMDDLSRQQRAIVHSIAMNWDAMSAKEIAEQTRLPSKTVSAQLIKLQQQWIIDKIETNTKNHLYIVKERFFNIWYLMRYGNQTDRRRVLWLTRFLESWCDENELINRLFEIDEAVKNEDSNIHQDYINALLSSEKMPYTLKKYYSIELKKQYPDTIEVKKYEYDDFTKKLASLIKNNQKYQAIDCALLQIQSKNIPDILFAGNFLEIFLGKDDKIVNRLFDHAETVVKENGYTSQDIFQLVHWYYISNNIERRKNCLDIISYLNKSNLDEGMLFFLATIKLWNNDYEGSLDIIKDISHDFSKNILISSDIEDYLILLLSKGQSETVYGLIKRYNLKDRFKAIYYATVSLLKDDRQQEYLRMGSELQSTVDEILAKIEEYRIKYA